MTSLCFWQNTVEPLDGTMERSQMWLTLFSLKWHKIKCLGERKQAIKKVTAETKMKKS